MAETVEDLYFPPTVVSSLILDALPEGSTVSEEAAKAIGCAGSLFALHITAQANKIAIQSKRNTINGSDIFQALRDTKFEFFEERLKETNAEFKKTEKLEKKAAAAKKKVAKDKKNSADTNAEEKEKID